MKFDLSDVLLIAVAAAAVYGLSRVFSSASGAGGMVKVNYNAPEAASAWQAGAIAAYNAAVAPAGVSQSDFDLAMKLGGLE